MFILVLQLRICFVFYFTPVQIIWVGEAEQEFWSEELYFGIHRSLIQKPKETTDKLPPSVTRRLFLLFTILPYID